MELISQPSKQSGRRQKKPVVDSNSNLRDCSRAWDVHSPPSANGADERMAVPLEGQGRGGREKAREKERENSRKEPLCTSATNGVISGACLSVRVAQTTERAVMRGRGGGGGLAGGRVPAGVVGHGDRTSSRRCRTEMGFRVWEVAEMREICRDLLFRWGSPVLIPSPEPMMQAAARPVYPKWG